MADRKRLDVEARIKKRVANRLKYLDAQTEEKDKGKNKDLRRIEKRLSSMDSELAKVGIYVPNPVEKSKIAAHKTTHGTNDLLEASAVEQSNVDDGLTEEQRVEKKAEQTRVMYANLAVEVESIRKQQQETQQESKVAINKLQSDGLDAKIRGGFETAQKRSKLQEENDALRKCMAGGQLGAGELAKLLAGD